MLGDVAAHRHPGEHLGHELAARPAHHRVRGGDDEGLGAPDIGLQRQPAALRHVADVDVAPQVPLADLRVLPVGGELLVVVALHDVGEAQADDRDPAPASELPGHLLTDHLGQRVAGLWAQRVRLIHRCVLRWLVERQAQRGLAGGPDHPPQPEPGGRGEDRVGAEGVGADDHLGGGAVRRRDRRQVHHRVRAGQRLDGLAEVGQLGGQMGDVGVARRHQVDVDHLVAVLQQVADHRAARLAAAARDHDPHGVGSCAMATERTPIT